MEISLSKILAPVANLIELLFLPKLAYYFAVFAYTGIINGETLTHFGMRKGVIARIYGVFYAFCDIFVIAVIPLSVKLVLETDGAKMQQALSFAIPIPQLGFVFVGLAVFLFLLREALVRLFRKKIRKNESARKIYNAMILFLLAIGIQIAIGLPYWIFVGIFAAFIYFSPIISPKEVSRAMRVPTDKKSRKKTAAS